MFEELIVTSIDDKEPSYVIKAGALSLHRNGKQSLDMDIYIQYLLDNKLNHILDGMITRMGVNPK